MEGLNPCLDLVFTLRRGVDAGESPRTTLRRWCQSATPFALQCEKWMLLYEKGGDADRVFAEVGSKHRRMVLRLIAKSMEGHSIQSALKDLEGEVIAACREEMDRHVALLPYKLMVPLLTLVLPALLILLFGPLLSLLSQSLSG